jgi:PAS domain S-box-containing protein
MTFLHRSGSARGPASNAREPSYPCRIRRRPRTPNEADDLRASPPEALVQHCFVDGNGRRYLVGVTRSFEERQSVLGEKEHQVFESLLEGCQIIDSEWRYVYVNDAAVKQSHLSRGELIGRTMMECYPGIEDTPMFEELQACMKLREHRSLENRFEFADGSDGWFILRFVPIPAGVCVLSLDVTEERRAAARLASVEGQLYHAQKMEAVGRLAGGIAHDFNNILCAILTYADLLIETLEPGNPLREDVEEIRHAGDRGARLTGQLLAFSRQDVLSQEVLDLNRVVTDMKRMIERLIGEDVDLHVFAAPAPVRACIDRGRLEQLVMNLVVNARDAMPLGGKLTLELARVELDEEYAEDHPEVVPGPYVLMVVSDTGSGIREDVRSRIFEPFFTTKEQGKGTGLGLSTVFGIVKQNRGHIWVYSEEGQGTTFKVYLPECDEAARPISRPPPSRIPRGDAGARKDTVLVVDDDEQVRSALCRVLERDGYRVHQASEADRAEAIALENVGIIDLLLTDVVLRSSSGVALAGRLVEQCPGLRVVLMSGHTSEAAARHGVLTTVADFLQKPITSTMLRQTVRQVLDRPAPK